MGRLHLTQHYYNYSTFSSSSAQVFFSKAFYRIEKRIWKRLNAGLEKLKRGRSFDTHQYDPLGGKYYIGHSGYKGDFLHVKRYYN